MDRWQSKIVICEGGLDLSSDVITQGTVSPGSARILQNFEAALEGGYRRIDGFSKWDSTTVTGDSNAPILGVFPAFGNVFAVRKTSTDYAIYKSSGSGWSSALNSTARTNAVNKARFIKYSLSEEVIVLTDGANPAWKYNNSTETLLNSTGAPTAPTFGAYWKARLVLSQDQDIYISTPNDDTVFAGGGAIQINVGDEITGLKVFRDSLFVFCENSIFKLVGNSSADFEIQPVTTSIGCLAGDTIVEVGGDLLFLAPDGLRTIAGTDRVGDIELALQSRRIQPIIRPIINSSIDSYSAFSVRQKSQYRLLVSDNTVSDDNSQGFIGKLDGTAEGGLAYQWSTTSGISGYAAASSYDGATEVVVFGHPTNGYVYQLESGNTFDGQMINAIYASPYMTFDDTSLRKVMQKLEVFTQAEGTSNITLGVKFDFERNNIPQPPTITLENTGDIAKYGEAEYGTDEYSTVQFPVFKKNLVGSGFTTSFRFDSDEEASFRIDSYVIQFGLKGRR